MTTPSAYDNNVPVGDVCPDCGLAWDADNPLGHCDEEANSYRHWIAVLVKERNEHLALADAVVATRDNLSPTTAMPGIEGLLARSRARLAKLKAEQGRRSAT